MRFDKLIPGMTAACHLANESEKYFYLSTLGHVLTLFCFFKCRLDEFFVAK